MCVAIVISGLCRARRSGRAQTRHSSRLGYIRRPLQSRVPARAVRHPKASMFKSAISARNPVLLRAAPATLLALLFMLATGLLDGDPGVAPDALFHAPEALFANALPGLLLALVLLAFTRRWVFSLLIAFGAEALLYWVNAQKIANLASPIVPADFHMLGQLDHGGAHLLSGYAHLGGWPMFAAAGGVIALIALWTYEPPLIPRRALPRTGIAACAAAALLSLCAGVPGWRVIYNRDSLQFQPWSATETAKRSGVISMLALYKLDYASQRLKIDTKEIGRAHV